MILDYKEIYPARPMNEGSVEKKQLDDKILIKAEKGKQWRNRWLEKRLEVKNGRLRIFVKGY